MSEKKKKSDFLYYTLVILTASAEKLFSSEIKFENEDKKNNFYLYPLTDIPLLTNNSIPEIPELLKETD